MERIGAPFGRLEGLLQGGDLVSGAGDNSRLGAVDAGYLAAGKGAEVLLDLLHGREHAQHRAVARNTTFKHELCAPADEEQHVGQGKNASDVKRQRTRPESGP